MKVESSFSLVVGFDRNYIIEAVVKNIRSDATRVGQVWANHGRLRTSNLLTMDRLKLPRVYSPNGERGVVPHEVLRHAGCAVGTFLASFMERTVFCQ